jgi:hypothetical protein
LLPAWHPSFLSFVYPASPNSAGPIRIIQHFVALEIFYQNLFSWPASWGALYRLLVRLPLSHIRTDIAIDSSILARIQLSTASNIEKLASTIGKAFNALGTMTFARYSTPDGQMESFWYRTSRGKVGTIRTARLH